uniref:EMI domain-containing protein n=1 Tax=Neogobius melanostomus TaxID=47308 RepID=A0A8C6TF27_9GOBI
MKRVLLLLGLLLSAHSELRARDPEVEQEDGGPEATDPRGSSVQPREVPQGKATDRSGNWCAVVQKRVVTTAVMSGTEQYTAKSKSPCPSRALDCQLIMYKLSTRPVYRLAERMVTSLLWQCCPGHTGHNCDHAVSSAQLHLTHSEHSENAPHHRGSVVGDRTNLVLPVPHMMALVMSQLQPVLEAFNHSLVHMQNQLGALTLEVAELKGQSAPEPQASSMSRDGLEDGDRLEQVYQELTETKDQLQQQRHLLDSHHASLLSNLTRLRTDMNVNVQAMNRSLSELKLDPKQPSSAAQGSETSALWRAVERLDNRVVNNTVKVQVLLEDVEVVSGRVQQLHRLQRDQDKRINDTSRRSQVQFMETGLEVEDAKVVVLRRVEELAGNMSVQGKRLADLEVDVDYLYDFHYKQNSSSGDSGCSELRTVITHLQMGLTNVTELANENRMALEESGEQGDLWGDSEWQPAVEALQQELQQIKWSWTLEENRTRAVEHSVTDLSRSLQQWQAAVTRLQQTEVNRTKDNQYLRGSFNSLLKDAIRHSDVLELLLGEEVLEFLDWPIHDQEAHSIPALKERLRQHEEQLSAHNQSIARLTDDRTGAEEVHPADEPSSHSHTLTEWDSSDRGPARERQSILGPQLRDGSDLWKLEQIVEELQRRVETMDENQNRNGQRDPRLQDEVMWLKRGLEDHLRVFKNIFSNTDKLAASKQPLELDKVFELVKSRQRRKGGSGGTH